MLCPICHTEMEFLPDSNRWVCRQALQNEVEYYIDAETIETSLPWIDLSDQSIPPLDATVINWLDMGQIVEVPKVTIRDRTKEWFNPMPKSLKLMLISLDPEIESVMHHYKDWDVKNLQYHEFMSSTQRALQKAYEERHPS